MPPQAPRAAPRSAPSGGGFNMPGGQPGMPNAADMGGAYNQTTGFSEQQKIQRSVAKSKRNAGVLKAVKLTRQQLEQWLAQFGLKLLTSSIELQMTHNFINSSYVIYPNGSQISLAMFLKQTDQNIQSIAAQINTQLSGIASQLEVVSPNQSQNPFEQQFVTQNPNQGYYPQPQQGYYPIQNQAQQYQPQPNYYPPQQPQYAPAPQNYNPNQGYYPQLQQPQIQNPYYQNPQPQPQQYIQPPQGQQNPMQNQPQPQYPSVPQQFNPNQPPVQPY
jgi:hypothetical protein